MRRNLRRWNFEAHWQPAGPPSRCSPRCIPRRSNPPRSHWRPPLRSLPGRCCRPRSRRHSLSTRKRLSPHEATIAAGSAGESSPNWRLLRHKRSPANPERSPARPPGKRASRRSRPNRSQTTPYSHRRRAGPQMHPGRPRERFEMHSPPGNRPTRSIPPPRRPLSYPRRSRRRDRYSPRPDKCCMPGGSHRQTAWRQKRPGLRDWLSASRSPGSSGTSCLPRHRRFRPHPRRFHCRNPTNSHLACISHRIPLPESDEKYRLGGNSSDSGNGIAVDAAGNAYVVGDTTSLNFPASGWQRANHGGQDAFVAKLSADGSRLAYSTYLGGANTDHGAAIAVDTTGAAWVAGSTWSADFPVANAFQSAPGGGQDAFVARLAADGNTVLFGSYLGGSGGSLAYPEAAQAIALDWHGNAYVAGVASSANFPLLNPLQSSIHGARDAFVAKVNASGTLAYSTYLGGSGAEVANAIAVDSSGAGYVAGYTCSTDLAVANALQSSNAGDCDAFLARVSATGTLDYLTYLGGNGSDTATAVAVTSGNVYVAGWTLSTNFPLRNPYQSIDAGNYGAFVTKLNSGSPPVNEGVTPNSGGGASQTFGFQFSDASGVTDLTTVLALFNSSPSAANGCAVV